jgi:hypothetical protein
MRLHCNSGVGLSLLLTRRYIEGVKIRRWRLRYYLAREDGKGEAGVEERLVSKGEQGQVILMWREGDWRSRFVRERKIARQFGMNMQQVLGAWKLKQRPVRMMLD